MSKVLFGNLSIDLDSLPHFKPEPFDLLDRVNVEENGEQFVNLIGISPRIQIEERCKYPFLRKKVAGMLLEAVNMLPEEYKFALRSCYRDIHLQAKAYWKYYKEVEEKHPEWQKSALRRHVNRFIAPPDRKSPPGHCTGAAIDLTIIGPDGEALDMYSPYHSGSTFRDGQSLTDTFTPKIDNKARANRALLIYIMTKVGFSNCMAEWWHYSWGDSAWAVRVGEKTAVYGLGAGSNDPNLARWMKEVEEKETEKHE